MIISVFFFNCSSPLDELTSKEDKNSTIEKNDLKELEVSLNELNAKYTNYTRVVNGVTASRVLSTVMADVTGWNWGKRAGFWVGTFVGGFGGMVPGYYIGGLIGGAACSAITYYGSSTAPSSRTTTMLKVAYANDNLAEDKLDSIGYYHNLIVGQIYSDRKLYTLSDGTPDYNAIVNRCIKLCKIYGIGDGVIKRTSVIETVDFCKKVHLLHKTCLNQQFSQAELIKRSENLLNNNLKLTVVEMDKIKLVNEKVVKVYCSLAPSVIPIYSKDLEQTISKSEISLELKEEILSTAAFVSNSALCAN